MEPVSKRLHNGSTVESYPLTQSQQMMYFVYNSYGANVPVLNIGMGYYWRGELDEELMRQALGEAVQRCDTMRLRFAEDRRYGLVQYIVEKSEIDIKTENLSGMTREEAWQHFKNETYEMIDMFEKPLHTLKIVRLADGEAGLYMKFHHLAMDGYSVKVFLADVMAIYLSKKTGSAYPKPMQPYIKAMNEELAYLTSKQREEDRNYWINYFACGSEPVFTDYLLENRLDIQRRESGNPNLRYALIHSGSPQARSVYYEMSKEESDAVMNSCEKNGISLASALMLSLRTALSVFNHNEKDVSFKFMVNRRGSLLAKKSGGIRFAFFGLRSVVEPGKTFREALETVENAEAEIFRHSSFATMEMYNIKHAVMNMATLDESYESTSFSYQPLMEIPSENEEMKSTSRGVWYNNDVSAQNFYITVKHRTNDNGLEFIFEVRTDTKPGKGLDIFYEKMRSALLIGTKQPEIKIGELLTILKL